jgi:hypothetical protein
MQLPHSTPSSATHTLALACIQAARDKADAAMMSVCQHLLHDTVSSFDSADLGPVLGRKWYHTYLVFFKMVFFLLKTNGMIRPSVFQCALRIDSRRGGGSWRGWVGGRRL